MFADLDLTDIDLSKNTVDPAGHYSRPDVTALVCDNEPDPPPQVPYIRTVAPNHLKNEHSGCPQGLPTIDYQE